MAKGRRIGVARKDCKMRQKQEESPHIVGSLTTTTDFTAKGKIDLSSGKPWSVYFVVDKDDEMGHVGLRLGKPPEHAQAEVDKHTWFMSKVWFKEGKLTIQTGEECWGVTIDPTRGGKRSNCLSDGKPIMTIVLPNLPNVKKDAEVQITLFLEGVEPLRHTDVGVFSGSGKAFAYPREVSLASMLRDDFMGMDFADFKLVCQGEEFKCHKFALASVSPVFKMYLTSDSMEAQQGFIKIDDAQPMAIARLLGFIYTGKIAGIDKSDSVVDDVSQLLQLSHKYDIPSLTRKCTDILLYLMWDENASDILRLARFLNLGDLETKAQRYMASRAKDIIKTDAWNQLLANDPLAANKIIEELLLKMM